MITETFKNNYKDTQLTQITTITQRLKEQLQRHKMTTEEEKQKRPQQTQNDHTEITRTTTKTQNNYKDTK